MHNQDINEYMWGKDMRKNSGKMGFLSPSQWLIIQDPCTVLSMVEKATRIVSCDNTGINVSICVVVLLEQTLYNIIDRSLEV